MKQKQGGLTRPSLATKTMIGNGNVVRITLGTPAGVPQGHLSFPSVHTLVLVAVLIIGRGPNLAWILRAPEFVQQALPPDNRVLPGLVKRDTALSLSRIQQILDVAQHT